MNVKIPVFLKISKIQYQYNSWHTAEEHQAFLQRRGYSCSNKNASTRMVVNIWRKHSRVGERCWFESHLSLLSVSVTANKCDGNFSVKIKVLNFKIKFSGHFQNSVKFVNLVFNS